MVELTYETKEKFTKKYIETIELTVCYPDPKVESTYLIDTFIKKVNEKYYCEAWLYEEESMHKLMAYHSRIGQNDQIDEPYAQCREHIIEGIMERIKTYNNDKKAIMNAYNR